MTDGILCVGRHLGEGQSVALTGFENRVVSKPAIAARGIGDASLTDPLYNDRCAIGPMHHDDGPKSRSAMHRRDAVQPLEEEGPVLRIGRPGTSEPCRMHPWLAIERVNVEPGVVGDRRDSGGGADRLRFQSSIAFEGVGIFDDLANACRAWFKLCDAVEERRQFCDFARIRGGADQSMADHDRAGGATAVISS